MPTTPATLAATALGLDFEVTQHDGPIRSLAEAAAARGIDPHDLVKTLVVRRGTDDYLFLLVPGDGTFSWRKLRTLLGVSRLSLPDGLYALLILSGGTLVFAATNLLDGSGFLAVYLAGVVVGNRRSHATEHVLQVMDGLAWLAQAGMFVVLMGSSCR